MARRKVSIKITDDFDCDAYLKSIKLLYCEKLREETEKLITHVQNDEPISHECFHTFIHILNNLVTDEE